MLLLKIGHDSIGMLEGYEDFVIPEIRTIWTLPCTFTFVSLNYVQPLYCLLYAIYTAHPRVRTTSLSLGSAFSFHPRFRLFSLKTSPVLKISSAGPCFILWLLMERRSRKLYFVERDCQRTRCGWRQGSNISTC